MIDSGEDTTRHNGVAGALSTVCDTLGDLATGIPAPIRKNAIRAFARLCTAAVEYPVALIEAGIAEKRAESDARVKLINASAGQIAEQMHINPEYARAAASKFAHKIIRERVNVDQISEIAASELKSEPTAISDGQESEASPISENWLNAFENAAAQMSSEQMQHLFGRILAGEIRRPTSYSIKTVKIISELDNTAAALFRVLCSLSLSQRMPNSNIVLDARVVSMGNAGANSLDAYGLGFFQLNILQEYGLIIPDYSSWVNYRPSVQFENFPVLPVTYANDQWIFIPIAPFEARSEFRVAGTAFTRSGKELLPIIECTPNAGYTTAVKKFFKQQGMLLQKVKPVPGDSCRIEKAELDHE